MAHNKPGIRRPPRSFGILNRHGPLQSRLVRIALFFAQKNRLEKLEAVPEAVLVNLLLADTASNLLLADTVSILKIIEP